MLLQTFALADTPQKQAVQHPLLEKVRRCSTDPDLAEDFFSRVLDPAPTLRPTAAEALQHPYLQGYAYQMHQDMLSAQNNGSRVRSHVRDTLLAALNHSSCTNQQAAMEGGCSVDSRSVLEQGSSMGYRDSPASSNDGAKAELVPFVRSDSAMSLQIGRTKRQMQTMTEKPKSDALARSDRPLEASCRSPLLSRNQLSQPAELVAAPRSSKQAGAWPPAMPANSSLKQLALKAHPLRWSPEEEQGEEKSVPCSGILSGKVFGGEQLATRY